MHSEKIERRKREIRSRNRKRRAFLGMMVLFVLMLLVLFLQKIGREEQSVSPGNPLDRISSLEELNEKTREAAELFLRIAEEEGLPVLVTETYRTQERQEYLYEQGRSRPGQVVTWTKTPITPNGMPLISRRMCLEKNTAIWSSSENAQKLEERSGSHQDITGKKERGTCLILR